MAPSKSRSERTRRLLCCLLAVYAWGLAAHGYLFFNHIPTHDAVTEIDGALHGDAWKISIGRVFVPLYRALTRGSVTLPLLIGLLALLYIALGLYLMTELFELRRKRDIILAAGILTTNLTVTATAATYLNDLDSNMFAFFLATLSVALLYRTRRGALLGMLPLCVSLGLYQSYLSVALTLYLCMLFLLLLRGEASRQILTYIKKGALLFLGSGILYLISMRLVPLLLGIDINTKTHNSVWTLSAVPVADFLKHAGQAFLKCGYELLLSDSVYPAALRLVLHLVFYLIGGWALVCLLRRNKTALPRLGAMLLLLFLLPFAMNLSYILQGGTGHDLMYYAFWLAEVMVLVLVLEARELLGSVCRACLCLCCVLLLWGNLRTSNTLYEKKQIEYDANLSLFTRILYRMESCEGYREGMPVVFVEIPIQVIDTPESFESVRGITGAWGTYSTLTGDPDAYRAYFEYVLLRPINLAEDELWEEMQRRLEVDAMPTYPAPESVQVVDGVLVVKLGMRF